MRTIGGVPVDAAFWATTPADVAAPLTPERLECIMREAWQRENARPPTTVFLPADIYRKIAVRP